MMGDERQGPIKDEFNIFDLIHWGRGFPWQGQKDGRHVTATGARVGWARSGGGTSSQSEVPITCSVLVSSAPAL